MAAPGCKKHNKAILGLVDFIVEVGPYEFYDWVRIPVILEVGALESTLRFPWAKSMVNWVNVSAVKPLNSPPYFAGLWGGGIHCSNIRDVVALGTKEVGDAAIIGNLHVQGDKRNALGLFRSSSFFKLSNDLYVSLVGVVSIQEQNDVLGTLTAKERTSGLGGKGVTSGSVFLS